MGNTQKLGNLVNGITVDASGNIGIAAAPSGSYKFEVTGEGRFYQSATSTTAYLRVENNRTRNAAVYTATTNGGFYAGTSIGTDTFNYQIYDGVAGSARLTISSTGAATFSSSVTAGGNITLNSSAQYPRIIANSTYGAGSAPGFGFQDNSVDKWAIAYSNSLGGLQFYQEGVGTNVFFKNGGNVVIGGTTAGTSLNTSLTVNNSSAGNYSGLIAMTADVQRGYYGGTSAGLEIGVSGSGGFTIWTNGVQRLGISNAGRTTLRGGTANNTEYALVVENSTPSNLFWVRNDGVSYHSSNVGIGIASPTELLHLYKSSGNVVIALQSSTNYAYLYNDSTNIVLGSNAGTTGAKFLVNRNAPDNAMSITSGGNVLINKTSDSGYKLQVSGTTQSSAFITDNGSTSVPWATWTNVYSLVNYNNAVYLFIGYLNGYTNYTCYATILQNDSGTVIANSYNSTLQVQMSGLNIQVYQNSGSTQTIGWRIIRIG
jgi:hypothetical protein